MNISFIVRICLVGLGLLAIPVIWEAGLKDQGPGNQLVFFLVVGVIVGLLGVKYIIPWFGDALGTAMYSSGEQVQMDEGMKAASKMAQGDYEGAIAEYERVAKEKPEDTFPIAEIAKIYADKLDDPQRALAFLQQRLDSGAWDEDAAAFLMFRMVDIKLDALKDYQGAHDQLIEITGKYPNTRHSANANHKVREVEQAQFKANMEKRLKSGGQN